MKDCVSPNSYIDWSFYSIIAAALERRVWSGSEINPLFPNLYVVLVGPPGVGKGRVLGPVKQILKHHKVGKKDEIYSDQTEVKNVIDVLKTELPTKIQVGADSTTYEALVRAMSLCIRAKHYPSRKLPYSHSSLAFCLEEISSLFRKHTEDLVNFLLVSYDCGDYHYSTISRGSNRIKSCCLNILAGTTPGFIKTIFGDELLTDGFASRTIFVSENESRFRSIKPSEFCPEQITAYNKILDHIKLLVDLYGEVKFTNEASKYLHDWWQTEPKTRINKSTKLYPYYARKDITLKKMAMVLHFCDSTSMEVTLGDIEKALRVLDGVEKTMHTAVTLDNKNPLAKVTGDILRDLIDNGPKQKVDLIADYNGELVEGIKSLDVVLDYLNRIGKIKLSGGKVTAI